MNCKTCIWNKCYFNDEGMGLEYLCTCDYETYQESELFDCNEYDMKVEVKPK